MDNMDERRRWNIPQLMTVRQSGGLGAEPGDLIGRMPLPVEVQADGRNTHDPAAAFAVVDGLVDGAPPPSAERRDSGQAGISRRAALKQFGNVGQPAAGIPFTHRIRLRLRAQPLLTARRDPVQAAAHGPPSPVPCRPKEQAVRREQRHLSVVRDERRPVHKGIFGNAVPSVPAEDGIGVQKFHGIPEGVPCGTAEQAPPVPVQAFHSASPFHPT